MSAVGAFVVELADTVHSDERRGQLAAAALVVGDGGQSAIIAQFIERMLTHIAEVLTLHVEVAVAVQCCEQGPDVARDGVAAQVHLGQTAHACEGEAADVAVESIVLKVDAGDIAILVEGDTAPAACRLDVLVRHPLVAPAVAAESVVEIAEVGIVSLVDRRKVGYCAQVAHDVELTPEVIVLEQLNHLFIDVKRAGRTVKAAESFLIGGW